MNIENSGIECTPIARITFVVRDPVPTNQYYGRRGARKIDPVLNKSIVAAGRKALSKFSGGVGLFTTKKGKLYKLRVWAAASVARFECKDWPTNPWRVSHVRLSYQLYNYRGDTDGVRKALRDSAEGVLYQNDRVVEDGPAPLSIRDCLGKRLVATVQLLSLRSDEEAQNLQIETTFRALERARRKCLKPRAM